MHPTKSSKASTQGLGWIEVGRGGVISASQIMAIARANSAPVKRLLQAAGQARILNLTYGEPRESVLLLDDGYLAVTSVTLAALLSQLQGLPHA